VETWDWRVFFRQLVIGEDSQIHERMQWNERMKSLWSLRCDYFNQKISFINHSKRIIKIIIFLSKTWNQTDSKIMTKLWHFWRPSEEIWFHTAVAYQKLQSSTSSVISDKEKGGCQSRIPKRQGAGWIISLSFRNKWGKNGLNEMVNDGSWVVYSCETAREWDSHCVWSVS
jgi:hypothetical protein